MNKLTLRAAATSVALWLAGMSMAAVNNFQPNYRLIDNPEFPTSDIGVATVNVLDYGIDNTGSRDCTSDLQQLLDKVAGVGGRTNNRGDYQNISGGTVYLPAGTYLCRGELTVPVGVTLRGDWQAPDDEAGVKGTVIRIEPSQWTDDQSRSFIVMQPCSQLQGLSFWYPGQNISDVRPASPTVLFGQPGYWGNEYCSVRDCTFVNSYTAIKFNAGNGGGCPNIFNIYGSPLSHGVIMDGIADVGRFDGLRFNPSVWASSGLDGAPSAEQLKEYLYENAVGISMRRNDWSYTCNLEVAGYRTAFLAEASPVEPSCSPNGHNYNFKLTDCKVGIELRDVSYPGIMFTSVTTKGCDIGVQLLHSGSGPVQLYGCSLEGRKGIEIADGSSSQLVIQDCDVSGVTHILDGHFQSVGSTFSGDVFISAKARTIFRGNLFTNGAKLDNKSLFECQVSDAEAVCRPLPEFRQEWMEAKVTQPARKALYVVEGVVALGIKDNLSSAPDCTSVIQGKLNEAGGAGGGIVYLPAGHYRLDGVLRIPSGVELKGASDLPNVPHGQGTILEVFNGRGNENGVPFITMDPRSGIRGIVVNYPNQKNSNSPDRYPYAIRGNADCYIVNVSLRAAYRGIDLFTNRCDSHYVDYLGGHAFANVLRVGGESRGGQVSNVQFNTIAYACGDETKFGQWPNSVGDASKGMAYRQNMRDLDFFIIGDCEGEVLYNNFLYGCNKGMHFVNDGRGGASSVHSVGNAVDGAVNTFVIEGIAGNLDLVNSQVVALNSDADGLEAHFVTLGRELGDRQVTFFSSDHWGGGRYFATVESGTLNLYNAHADQCGSGNTFNITGGGTVNLTNSILDRPNNFTANPGDTERRLHAIASTMDPVNANTGAMATWEHNLATGWNFVRNDVFLSRDGWKATAFNDVNGTNPVSKEGPGARSAVDGDSSTRWDSRGSQNAGQWFMIDFGKELSFNTILLDTSGSANDGPAGYTMEAYYDGGWHELTSGTNAGAMLVANFPAVTASRIRINQTGSKGNYWSIHEINIANAMMEAPEIPTGIDAIAESAPLYIEGNSLLVSPGLVDDNSLLTIHSIQGLIVIDRRADIPRIPLSQLPSGLYIAVLHTPGATYTLKFRR